MFISPVNFNRITIVLLYLIVICNLNAQEVFKESQSKVPTVTKQVVRENSKSNIGSPEFDIKIISDYKASYGCSRTVGTNTYTFTNTAAITEDGESFASDIIVDLGAAFNETGFEDTTATLENALNSSANLIKIYINDMLFSNDVFEYNDGRYRVKIANIGDAETATILGFKDLDKDGVYDDLEEGGSFEVTTITSVECAVTEKGYNAARVLFNNNNGTNLRLETAREGYVLANQIEGNVNTVTFPSAIDYDTPFSIVANVKGLFDPRAYTGCKNQYTELVLTFSKNIDFSNVTFNDEHKRIITHTLENDNKIARIKIPLLESENQNLTDFKIDGLQIGCFSNSTVNVDWSWNYVCEDCTACKVIWLSGNNSIKTNNCTPFDLAVEKTISDINPYIGDEVILTTIIKNNSDVAASDIVIKELFSVGYDYVSSEVTGDYNPKKGEWKLSDLNPGGEKTLKVRAKILDEKGYVNSATIVSYKGGNDAIVTNNWSSVTASPLKPSLTLLQEGVFNDENNDTYAQVGETISYSFTIKNMGNTVLKDIIVVDPKINITGVKIDSLTSNSIDTDTFLGTYVIVQEDIDLGAFHNKAEVVGYDIKNNVITNIAQDINNIMSLDNSCIDCAVTLLPQKVEISLIKSFSIDDVSLDGVVGNLNDVITYHFDIFNTGNVTLSNVIVDDPMLESTKLTVVPNILQPSEIGQLSLTYTITQKDIDRGYVENIATAIAELPFGDSTSSLDDIVDESDAGTDFLGVFIESPNEIDSPSADGSFDSNPTNDPTLVKLASNLDLFIIKEVDNLKPSINDEVVFTIKLLNNGNTTIHNIKIEEEIPNGYEYISHFTTVGSYTLKDNEWVIPTLNLDDEVILTITVRVLEDGDYLNTASVLSYDGIADSDESNNEASAVAAPTCLTIYNEFSPNDDGINDTFEIDCIQNYKDNALSVFNRWGTTVYQKINYDNSWDGISNTGKELPVGTYYYVLKLNDGSKDKTGWLFINR